MTTASSTSKNPFYFDYNAAHFGAMLDVTNAKFLALDTETTGLRVKQGEDYCIGISVAGRRSDGKMFSHYFPIRHATDNLTDENREILFNHLLSRTELNPLILHNVKFDLFSTESVGLCLDSVFFFDTMMMARMVNENYPRYTLDWLSKNLLKREGKRKSDAWNAFFSLFGGWKGTFNFPPFVMGDYATGDTEETLLLFEWLWPKFLKEGFYVAG